MDSYIRVAFPKAVSMLSEGWTQQPSETSYLIQLMCVFFSSVLEQDTDHMILLIVRAL